MTNYDQLYSPPKAPASPAEAASYDVGDALFRAEFGGIGIRLLAHVIDQITIAVLGFGIGFIDGLVRTALTGAAPDPELSVGTFASSIVASLLLFTLSEGIGGVTLGKAICGLEVRDERLERCTIRAALVRSLGLYFDLLFCGIPGITSINGSRLKQRYGDKWARTIVVKSSSVPPVARNQRAMGILIGAGAWTVVTMAPMVAGWIP